MNVTELAREAANLFTTADYDDFDQDGVEVAPGWTSVYNSATGQSKRVLLNHDANLIFKWNYGEKYDETPPTASQRTICEITIEEGTFTVRLPYFEHFEIDGAWIEVQEFVNGRTCKHAGEGYSCECVNTMRRESGCFDTHNGNWLILDNEIVLFDFDGIKLPD